MSKDSEFTNIRMELSKASVDEEERIVKGELFAPMRNCTHGDVMTRKELRIFMERFMQLDFSEGVIDIQHDNVPINAFPIEVYQAEDWDPVYTPGAMVLTTKILDDDAWERVKGGDLNGYSLEARVRAKAVVAALSFSPDNFGITEEANGHRHLFYAKLKGDGTVKEGRTSTDNGHDHEIKRGTATEPAGEGSNRHAHRIFI
jgi:hypothetical protein